MKKYFFVWIPFISLLILFLSLAPNLSSYAEAQLSQAEREELEKRVEKHLRKNETSLRPDVEDVFLLAEIYESEGKEKEAIKLYQAGLKADSWRLNYQLKLARLLYKHGDTNQAIEKLRIIYHYSEDEDLITEARKFLNEIGASVNESVEVKEQEFIEDIEIVIVPVGKVNKRLLSEVRDDLQRTLGIKYSISKDGIELGDFDRGYKRSSLENIITYLSQLFFGYNKSFKNSERSGQYDAYRLLSNLKKKCSLDKKSKIKGYLGITEGDIYAMNYNYLFGWSFEGYAIMSYHRFMYEFCNRPPNRPKLRNRLVKQGISSSFFILGIHRCTTPNCARAYPHNLVEHDQKDIEICSWCREQLNAYKKKNH